MSLNMKIGIFLILVIFPVVFSFDEEPGKNVSLICDGIKCYMNKICRIVRHCERPKCHPEHACIPCVPDGADVECNSLGYKYTVLHGYPDRVMTLVPHECNETNICPFGSKCVRHPVFVTRGVCCYGGPHGRPVTNDDRKCLVCVPQCQDGFSCIKVTDICGIELNECRPDQKMGKCPAPNRRLCFGRHKNRSCDHDQECPGLKKCCLNACGGRKCIYPTTNWS